MDLFTRDLPPANSGWLDSELIVLPENAASAQKIVRLLEVLGSGIGGYVLRFRLHAFEHKVFHLGPDVGIAFTLHVVGSDVPVKPGIAFTTDWGLVVVEAVIAEDAGFGIVDSLDFTAAVNESVRLVKVDRSSDVIGNQFIVLPELGHAVDLNREHHRDANAVEFTREQNNGGSAPTLAEKHDVGVGFFLPAEDAIPIGVE